MLVVAGIGVVVGLGGRPSGERGRQEEDGWLGWGCGFFCVCRGVGFWALRDLAPLK
jgi:hypothetical protein